MIESKNLQIGKEVGRLLNLNHVADVEVLDPVERNLGDQIVELAGRAEFGDPELLQVVFIYLPVSRVRLPLSLFLRIGQPDLVVDELNVFVQVLELLDRGKLEGLEIFRPDEHDAIEKIAQRLEKYLEGLKTSSGFSQSLFVFLHLGVEGGALEEGLDIDERVIEPLKGL